MRLLIKLREMLIMEKQLQEILDLVLNAFDKSSELPMEISTELKEKLDECATFIENKLINS
jgi:hypothetical protein